MEFRLLGLLEVSDGGRPIDLPRGQERALLVLLLLHANQPVSIDRLIDELWAGRSAPENAAKAIQVYVSRLRKALGANRLETTPAGYLLRIQEGELDTERFQRLAGEARGRLDTREPQRALDSATRALGLWQGDALADVRFASFAQGEIRRLEGLRDSLRADQIDARLELGKTDGLIAELEQMIAANPLAERPRGQLMLALYRAGRQSDALELYRRTRATLSEEFGIEPGPELQALERSILNQDPDLAPPRTAQAIAQRRGGWLLVGGGVLVLAAVATAVIVLVGSSGHSTISRLTPGSIGVVDERSQRITHEAVVGGSPARLAAGDGSVWVEGDQAGTLTAVDSSSLVIHHVAATSSFPSALAVGAGAVWVFDGSTGLLTERDPTYGTVLHRIRITPPNPVYDPDRETLLAPVSVAVGAGAAWTTDGSSTLTKVDPKKGKIAQQFDLHAPLDDVTVSGNNVWAISGSAAIAYHVTPAGKVTYHVQIASHPGAASPYPIAVAAGAGFVWVLNANTDTVTKIDPAQRTTADTISIGIEREPLRIVAGDGAAWVADLDGTLTRIDAATDKTEVTTLAGSLRDLAFVRGAVWVTAAAGAGPAVTAASVTGRVHALPTVSCTPIESAPGSSPSLLLVGEIALQGAGATTSGEAASAIRFVLAQHHFRAGRYAVGYQSCDSSAPDGSLDPPRCLANARADAADSSVIGVIGSWSSDCTERQVPILNGARGGSIATVGFSSSNTGVTHAGPGTAASEPGRYYPTGTRNYVRVNPANDVQGEADALAARRLGDRRVFVLEDDATGYEGTAAAGFATAARRLGLTVIGPILWNYAAKSYKPFADAVAQQHPDSIFLGTFLFAPYSTRLIQALKVAMPHAQLIAPDGFAIFDSLVSEVGAASEGMIVSEDGLSPDSLPPAGRKFAAAFRAVTGATPTSFAVLAAQATEVMLDAIARSNGSRRSVVRQLFATHVTNGLLGSFDFDRSGDTTASSITVDRIVRGAPTIYGVFKPH